MKAAIWNMANVAMDAATSSTLHLPEQTRTLNLLVSLSGSLYFDILVKHAGIDAVEELFFDNDWHQIVECTEECTYDQLHTPASEIMSTDMYFFRGGGAWYVAFVSLRYSQPWLVT
jgi:hypothetical protein